MYVIVASTKGTALEGPHLPQSWEGVELSTHRSSTRRGGGEETLKSESPWRKTVAPHTDTDRLAKENSALLVNASDVTFLVQNEDRKGGVGGFSCVVGGVGKAMSYFHILFSLHTYAHYYIFCIYKKKKKVHKVLLKAIYRAHSFVVLDLSSSTAVQVKSEQTD